MELRCEVTFRGADPVVAISGELDLATVPQLHGALSSAIAEHRGATVYVDLDGLHALDDAGLGVLLGAAGRARDAGGDLVILCSLERLRRRFALTGLDRAVHVRDRLWLS